METWHFPLKYWKFTKRLFKKEVDHRDNKSNEALKKENKLPQGTRKMSETQRNDKTEVECDSFRESGGPVSIEGSRVQDETSVRSVDLATTVKTDHVDTRASAASSREEREDGRASKHRRKLMKVEPRKANAASDSAIPEKINELQKTNTIEARLGEYLQENSPGHEQLRSSVDLSKAPSFVKGVEALDYCVNKSLFLPKQHFLFGRRGQLATCDESLLTICDPSAQQLRWTAQPKNILLIRKMLDDEVTQASITLLQWLVLEGLTAYLEGKAFDECKNELKAAGILDYVNVFKPEDASHSEEKIDMVITLGGDGTILYVTSLFPTSVPPLLAFHMGSLGFLSPFDFEEYRDVIGRALSGNSSLCLRDRLKCYLCRGSKSPCLNIRETDTAGMKLVLNEVVIDRGMSSQACLLELYIERQHVTSVRADGLIISTPTGSTAYAAAAGAAMVHPSIPCILLTPICSYSLSFRPILVPAGAEVVIGLVNSDSNSRCASVSFDGKYSEQLYAGDLLCISTSRFPVPCICKDNQVSDWFNGLARCLNWNVRQEQKPLLKSSSHTLTIPPSGYSTPRTVSTEKIKAVHSASDSRIM